MGAEVRLRVYKEKEGMFNADFKPPIDFEKNYLLVSDINDFRIRLGNTVRKLRGPGAPTRLLVSYDTTTIDDIERKTIEEELKMRPGFGKYYVETTEDLEDTSGC